MLKKEDPKIKWLQKARFGLFIHWGLYSALEGYWKGKETKGIGEWIQSREKIPQKEYEVFAEKLTCERFEPEYWARLAKRAGMGYCVFTAKHHEGFAMFDTAYDDYSIVKQSPCGGDVVAAVTQAMRDEGIIPCLYYSQALDFHEEHAWGNTWDYNVPELSRDFRTYFDGKCKTQIRELMTGYGNIGMLWMDVPKWFSEEMAQELIALIHSYQPNCLISGRITYSNKLGDFGCYGDNQIPAVRPKECWETAATMNDTWGYKRDDHHYKSVKELLELLCDLLAKGTNLLLNIGPKPDGSLTEETIHILETIGDWHEINAEAVSGTDASPFSCDVSFGGISQKEHSLYLYVYNPQKTISLYGIKNRVLEMTVLGGGAVSYRQTDVLDIDMGQVKYDPYVTVVKVMLDGKPDIKEGIRQQEKGQILLPACVGQLLEAYPHGEPSEKGCVEAVLDMPKKAADGEKDAALEADVKNAKQQEHIWVDTAGIVQNWNTQAPCLQWEFESEEAGEYAAYLYTVTEKYQPWKGGHHVCLEYAQGCVRKVLTADKASRGANQKYFAETGSFLGTIRLTTGKNILRLSADQINQEDTAGLGVSRLLLVKWEDM